MANAPNSDDHKGRGHEAEVSVIGACILDERALSVCRMICNADDFAREAHGILYASMLRLADAGMPVDFVTVGAELGTKRLFDAGGMDYLIACAEYVVSPANCQFYAEKVAEWSERRRMVAEAKALVGEALNDEVGIDVVRARAVSMGTVRTTAATSPFFRFSEVDVSGEDEGVSTGFACLDNLITTHGYPCGQISVVSAYHKGGKSTFMLSSYVNQVQSGKRALYATFADLNKKQLKRRMVRNMCGWGKRPSYEGRDQAAYDQALEDITMCFDADGYDATALDTGNDVETFLAWLRSMHRTNPSTFPEAVFIDYAQELHSSHAFFNEYAEGTHCASLIARFAAKMPATAFIVGSQITEGGKDGGRDRTKGTRAWEEKAGWVLRLSPNETDPELRDVKIAFSRFGGQDKTIPMRWSDERLRFESVN